MRRTPSPAATLPPADPSPVAGGPARAARRGPTVAWLTLTFLAFAATVSEWVSVWVDWDPPTWLPLTGAVAVSTSFAFALGVRTGGRPLIAGGLALLLGAGAALSDEPVLLAGAAVCTAALGSVLGVLATVPAARFPAVVREVLIATLVAVVAAFAAFSYDAPLAVRRTDYLVLGLSLLGALVVIYRLGAGFHGLGRRGTVVIFAGLILLAVVIAYTQAFTTWGSPGLVAALDDTIASMHDLLGAVPRPIEAILGVPALAWGISTRARRRQGWWPCAFGAAGLASIGTILLHPAIGLTEAGLIVGYGVLVGLVLGYLVIRVDAFLSGNRGGRARRAEEAAAHRPEPARTAPLL